MNNVAQLGINIAVKNVRQVEKVINRINDRLKKLGMSVAQNSKQMERSGKAAEDAGRKTQKTFDDADRGAQKLTKSLDGVVKKWVSIGGAVKLVSMIMRRAFAKIDEITGLTNMANSAGIGAKRIESLGKALREYGGDASSAAGAYTSMSDIIGAARSGRGISQDIVTAASRYGIALNGGMLTEDQLMTNIARAMQVQRKKGNMYGVRDIASAFGIDEAMMLHLSQAGANWDRGLPAAKLAEKQAEAQKIKDMQLKVSDAMDALLLKALPAIVRIGEILEEWYNKVMANTKAAEEYGKKAHPTIAGNKTNAYQVFGEKDSFVVGAVPYKASNIDDAIAIAESQGGKNSFSYDPILAMHKLKRAQELIDYYHNNNLLDESFKQTALNNVRGALSGIGNTGARLTEVNGKVRIELINNSGLPVAGQIVSNSVNSTISE